MSSLLSLSFKAGLGTGVPSRPPCHVVGHAGGPQASFLALLESHVLACTQSSLLAWTGRIEMKLNCLQNCFFSLLKAINKKSHSCFLGISCWSSVIKFFSFSSLEEIPEVRERPAF